MKNSLEAESELLKGGIFYLGLTVMWLLLTLIQIAPESRHFLQGILCNKLFWVMLLFTGSYLLFPHQINQKGERYLFGGIFLMLLLGKVILHNSAWSLVGFLVSGADLLIWAYCLSKILILLGGVYQQWWGMNLQQPVIFSLIWQHLWQTLAKFGLFLSLILVNLYYYLVNIFIIDTIFYSYFFGAILLGAALALYAIWYGKLKRWVLEQIVSLDQRLLLLWEKENDEGEALPRLRYLIMKRDYLLKLTKLAGSYQVSFYYLLYLALILALPYLLGVVVEV